MHSLAKIRRIAYGALGNRPTDRQAGRQTDVLSLHTWYTGSRPRDFNMKLLLNVDNNNDTEKEECSGCASDRGLDHYLRQH